MVSADGTAECVYQEWFLDVFLGPFSNINDRIMPTSDAVSSEGLKTTGIQTKVFALVPYTQIFPVSQNFGIMLCTVDVEICKAFAI